jgi:hypothetical protein
MLNDVTDEAPMATSDGHQCASFIPTHRHSSHLLSAYELGKKSLSRERRTTDCQQSRIGNLSRLGVA